jgi:hypothetical protein
MILDLKDTFFYILLHPDSQPIFAFEDQLKKQDISLGLSSFQSFTTAPTFLDWL